MLKMKVIGAVVLGALLAACSTVPSAQRMQARQAAFNGAAGAPVASFRYLGPMWSWEPFSDSQLVVYTNARTAYLLDVWGCPNLEWTQAIGLTSSIHEVSSNLDKVLTGGPYAPCPIVKIRPINLVQLKIEQASHREVDDQPRDAGGITSPAGGSPPPAGG
jgi:hypothetical protein